MIDFFVHCLFKSVNNIAYYNLNKCTMCLKVPHSDGSL